jgi:hypothetical protein
MRRIYIFLGVGKLKPTALDIINYLEGYGISSSIISDDWIEKRRDNLVIPWITKHTRLDFEDEKEITEYLSGNGKEILVLSKKPVNEIINFTYVSGGDTLINLSESIELDQAEGIIIKKVLMSEGDIKSVFPKGNKNIKITYKYGTENFIDSESNELVDIKEAIIYMTCKQILIQIGARTGGGSLSVEAHSRNYGTRGKYTDIINNLDQMSYEILRPYFTGVVGT